MKNFFFILLGIGLGAGLALSLFPPAKTTEAASATAPAAKRLWTCGMHPQIIQDHPGDCPICGMKLTPVRKEGGGADSATDAAIRIDGTTAQNMNLRTGTVVRGPLRRTVRTVGAVEYDETALADVTTKFRGWIEKLHVDATGSLVHKGDPLFDVYSPELYAAQVEYLLALKAGAGSDTLKASALTKLRFFDISDDQIAALEKDGMARRTLQVRSPRDGVVVEKMAVEGQLADSGMNLYRIADLATVWVLAQVYEQDLAQIRLGQEAAVTLAYLPDRAYRGRVTYVYPSVDPQTRTAKVRIELHNPGYALKPGMFASVTLESAGAADALLVPDSAVLRSGEACTVFVALADGKFEPRAITLGARADGGFYQVLSGLKEGEKIVTSGQFLLDSEAQLKAAISRMGGTSTHGNPEPQPGPKPPPEGGTTNMGAPVSYICPMPEHLSVTHRQPGNCPLCGMALVPVSPEMLAQVQPGETLDHYTCPMPEHADVHEAKPGKCPKCGMTLVPVMKDENAEHRMQNAEQGTTGARQPATRNTKHETASTVWYVCPMPEDNIRQDHPGKCPKCGMKLVPEKK